MTDWPAVPNLAVVLATHIASVPDEGQPVLLAGLERAAANRYRGWAKEFPDHAEALNACAAREDEIADRVDGLFPVSEKTRSALDTALPAAIQTYDDVFSEHSTLHQLYLQSEAELQGSQAWAAMASQTEDEATREILERCTALEIESSQALKALLEKIA